MSNNQIEVELEEETVELLAEIAESEGNSADEQLIKMLAIYTTLRLVSKTEQLQETLQKDIVQQ